MLQKVKKVNLTIPIKVGDLVRCRSYTSMGGLKSVVYYIGPEFVYCKPIIDIECFLTLREYTFAIDDTEPVFRTRKR